MTQPWSIPEGEHVVVRLRVHGIVRHGERLLHRQGLFGPLHVVSVDDAPDLVGKGVATCGVNHSHLLYAGQASRMIAHCYAVQRYRDKRQALEARREAECPA